MLRSKYLWFTLFLSWAISLWYFAGIWSRPNDFLFTASGDGLQGYYQSIWHTHEDSAAWKQSSMNYPFGESIFFTGGQPLLTNSIRLLQPIVNLSPYAVAISNVFILLSGILSAVFIFLCLQRLRVDSLWSSLFACGIMMTAQQWDRTSGHFALAVLCAVPLILWLLIIFFDAVNKDRQARWKLTITLTVVLFLLGLIQFYYIFFAAALAGGMAMVNLFQSRSAGRWNIIGHLAIQFGVAFIALQILLRLSTDVTDRTAIPWGFLIFRSSWMSYVFPYGMPYEQWFNAIKPENGLEWEGLSYLGLGGWFAIIAFLLLGMKHAFRRSLKLLQGVLALIVCSLLCVALSMAFPFNWGLENLLYKLGAIQQFRGIGRFAFVAFYPIVIAAIAGLYQFLPGSFARSIAGVLLVFFFAVDGHARLSAISERISQPRGELFRTVGQGLDGVDESAFQAIHPLPYVHVGSENIGSAGSDEAMRELYQTSLLTGLPTTATVMSRTSLSQAFASCCLSWELMEPPAILSMLHDSRPFLIIADTAHLDAEDIILLKYARPIMERNGFAYYELPLHAYDSVRVFSAGAAREKAYSCLKIHSPAMLTDSIGMVSYYNDTIRDITFSRGWKKMLDIPVQQKWRGASVALSFWVADFSRDLIPRSVLEIAQFNENKSVAYTTEFLGKRVVGTRDANALIEYIVQVDEHADRLTLALENKLLQGSHLQINSILIRPLSANCRILHHGNESLNNRIYSR